MKQLQKILKPSVFTMKPYAWEETTEELAQELGLDPKTIVRLDANTPLDPPAYYDQFITEIKEKKIVNLYDDFAYDNLSKLISNYEKVKPKEITCGNSGDEIIDIIGKCCLNQGDKFLVSTPTYSVFYIQCEINGGVMVDVPLNPETYKLEVDQVIQKANEEKVKIIWICNPNNPTSNVIASVKEIKKIIESCPDSLVVVDEAYIQFYDMQKSMSKFINDYPNLIVTRTCSKVGKIAGARVGYLIANEFLATKLNNLRFPMGIAYFSMEIAKKMFAKENLKYIEEYVQEVLDYRSDFINDLKNLGFEVFDSACNFVLFRFANKSGEKAKELNNYVQKKGFVLRPRDKKYIEGCIRCTIPTREVGEKLLGLFKEFLKTI